MFCKNCGKQIEDNSNALCSECLNAQTSQNSNNYQSVPPIQPTYSNNINNQKSKLAAGLLGIFLGALGVHNFYLGYIGKAVAQLLISILSCGILAFVSTIWGLIEGILILCGEINKDANGVPLRE